MPTITPGRRSRPALRRPIWRLLRSIFCALWLLLACTRAGALAAPAARLAGAPAASRQVFLPLVLAPDPMSQQTAIWTGSEPPAAHEVALFRHSFTLPEAAADAEVALFADTRYELWIDGSWVGRGPARFTRQTHEYDRFVIGELPAGRHVIAVLVQWAPNFRRSESQSPMLQATVRGRASRGATLLDATGSEWRGLRSDAWQRDAPPVHAWGLIGPTELLDLRRLPAGWASPGFDDSAWPRARPVAVPPAVYRPRSIPQLVDVPVGATVYQAGRLAPGRQIVDLPAAAAQPYRLGFSAQVSGKLTLDALGALGTTPDQIVRLDGQRLAWASNPAWHPDLRRATPSVTAGAHTLTFEAFPREGWSLAISADRVTLLDPPPIQSASAGRRLLLAELASDASAVTLTSAPQLDLAFRRAPSYAVLDLGRVVHGRLTAEVRGPAGTIVDIGWDERLWQGARPLPYPGSLHPEWNQTDSWVLDGQPRIISTIDARAGRYVLIASWGGGVQLANLRVLEERQPLDARGSFSSSDARLDQIWRVGVNTLYPNMSDAYADPWRERGQWWGDAFVDDHVNQAAFGSTGLLGRGLRQMAEAVGDDGRPLAFVPNGGGNYLLDYGMLWVQSARDYARAGGDPRLLGEIYPAITRLLGYLRRHENPSNGLLDLAPGHWSTTAYIDSSAHDADRYGQSTALNALYYGTLRDASDLADQLGDRAQASAWRQRADALRDQIRRVLYLPEQHRFRAGIIAGAGQPPSPQAQAWALAYDIAPADQNQPVADALLELMGTDSAAPHVGPYGTYWVLEGLARAGRVSDAVLLIKRLYGRMLDLGATTWWENFIANQSYSASLSHGWGGAPTWFLTTHLLGARRTGPFSWAVEPVLGIVPAAAGALPFGDSALRVSWASVGCGQLEIQLDAPAGSSGSLLVPSHGQPLVVRLDGVVIWQNGQPQSSGATGEPGGVRLTLGSGTHQIDAERPCDPIYLPQASR